MYLPYLIQCILARFIVLIKSKILIDKELLDPLSGKQKHQKYADYDRAHC